MDFWIGSITRMDGPGIVRVRLENDEFSLLWTDCAYVDPNWLEKGPCGRIYAVSSDGVGERRGFVNELIPDGLGLRLVNRREAGGIEPCHICLSDDGRFLFASLYHSGALAVFPLEDGSLGPCMQRIVHEGKSVHLTRQEQAHVHQVTRIPWLKRMYCACDLGTDELVVYEQDEKSGQFHRRYAISVHAGQGPRHVAYDGNRAWLLTELGNRVYSVTFGEAGGALGESASTLRDPPVQNTAAAIRTAAGKVYVSNRGEGTVACLDAITLSTLGRFPTGGMEPRDFILLPDGGILAACQDQGLSLLRGGEVVSQLPLPGAVSVLPV